MKKLKKYIIAVIVIIYSFMMIIFSEEVSQSVVKSINICINVIIPSMFIFMVISGYILSSNLYNTIFSPIYFLFKRIIKLDKQSFSIFLLSLIGGYPIGLKLIKEEIAQNKNYSEIAAKTASFCYCISPSFAITMIGIELYNSVQIGIAVYISNVIANIILAFIYSRIYNLKIPLSESAGSGNLITSVNSAASTLFRICSIIVFFNSAITAVECLLKIIGINLAVEIKSALEISNILGYETITPDILPFISALVSTGGVCVIFQSVSIVNGSFSLKPFLISRIFLFFINYFITSILINFWEISVFSATYDSSYIYKFNADKAVFVLLLSMCIILMQKSEKFLKKG